MYTWWKFTLRIDGEYKINLCIKNIKIKCNFSFLHIFARKKFICIFLFFFILDHNKLPQGLSYHDYTMIII